MTKDRTERYASNYIRMHRRRAGLTQRELEEVLGYGSEGPVSRHERFRDAPPLKMAIGYEIVFRVPIATLFAGLRDEMREGIEARLAQMEENLGQHSARDPNATGIARKLMWLSERRAPDYEPVP